MGAITGVLILSLKLTLTLTAQSIYVGSCCRTAVDGTLRSWAMLFNSLYRGHQCARSLITRMQHLRIGIYFTGKMNIFITTRKLRLVVFWFSNARTQQGSRGSTEASLPIVRKYTILKQSQSLCLAKNKPAR